MAQSAPKTYSNDPALYLYTSLTSGSSHIVTATSRMETILKANRIPFRAIDIATDEKARMLWGRRSGKDESGRVRKIPGLVQMGLVIGDLVEVEDWNEYGELKQHITIYHEGGAPAPKPIATPTGTSSKAPVLQENKKPEPSVSAEVPKSVVDQKLAAPQHGPVSLTLRQAGQEAAQKAKDNRKKAPVETLSGVGMAEPEPAQGTSRRSIDGLESLQSASSAAWKPSVVDGPVLTHRGSSVSIVSAEEIKQIEDEETIPEEDEEDSEEDESDEEEEEEEEEDDDDEEEEGEDEEEEEEEEEEDEEEDEDDDDDDDDDDEEEEEEEGEEDSKVTKKA